MKFNKESGSKSEHILAVAERLIAEKGFEATSVREIARNAGVNIAMISYYFGSKEKMLEKIFEQRLERSQLLIKEITESEERNEWEIMKSMLLNYINYVIQSQNFFLIMISIEVTTRNKRILSILRKIRTNYLELFDDLVKKGIQRKIFKNYVSPIYIQSFVNGSIYYATQSKPLFMNYMKNDKAPTLFDKDLFDQLYIYLLDVLKNLLHYEE